MPENFIPAAKYRTIPCPDCSDRPGCNLNSLNPDHPEPCPTCAGYGAILHPEEVERTKADYRKMRDRAAYDLKRRMVDQQNDRSDLKPWSEYIEGRWSA
jgi:hypothetical protein